MHSNVLTPTQEAWYIAGQINSSPPTTGAPAINVIHAVGWFMMRDAVVDQIGAHVTTGGGKGSVFRVGIYDSIAYNDWSPNALVVDSGEKDGTIIGVSNTTISSRLFANRFYWFVYFPGVAAPTIRALKQTDLWSPFGLSNTFNGTVVNGVTGAQAYGALPATFPITTERTGLPIPVVHLRFGG